MYTLFECFLAWPALHTLGSVFRCTVEVSPHRCSDGNSGCKDMWSMQSCVFD